MKKIIIICFVLLCGCREDFSPNGEYRQRLIVYGVIDGNSTTQYIRVYSTFSPDLYDPLKPAPNTEVANASVVLKNGAAAIAFHDTLITVTGSSGNRTVRVYVNNSFQPLEGRTYSLTVAAQGYDTVRSSFKGINYGDIYANSALLAQPGTEVTIPLHVALGNNAIAYLATISLEYRVGNDPTLRLKESPSSILKNANGDVVKRNYPAILLRTAAMTSVSAYEDVLFDTDAYLETAMSIKNEFGASSVTFTRAIISLKQFDTNLYTYYSITNSFGGSSTLRLDEPDYSNITNGFGVFGMMTQQDRSYGLPSNF